MQPSEVTCVYNWRLWHTEMIAHRRNYIVSNSRNIRPPYLKQVRTHTPYYEPVKASKVDSYSAKYTEWTGITKDKTVMNYRGSIVQRKIQGPCTPQ